MGRMEAEQKVESYSQIARGVFTASVDEAVHYFNEAVEVADKIGEENLERWSSLLELASKAAVPAKPKSELAYRFSRSAEVIYDYVARDKYFDWIGTVEAMTRLCPASSPTILSRWRDRNFGWDAKIFPEAIKRLVRLNEIDPGAQLACLAFKFHWEAANLLEEALSSCSNNEVRKRMFDETVHYILIQGTSSSELEQIIEIGKNNSWATSYLEPYLNFAISTEERDRESANHKSFSSQFEPKPSRYWDEIFADVDVDSQQSVAEAYRRMRLGEPPYYFSEFAKNHFGRARDGKEISAVRAIFGLPDFGLYHLIEVLESIPDSWRQRQSLKTILAKCVKNICRDKFYDISKSRFYQPLHFETIADYTGVTEHEIYKIAIEAYAETTNILGSQRLFNLVSLIAQELSSDEAEVALSYGLNLLEDNFDEKDGDGDWCSTLFPPTTAHQALAGYIWTGLAAPKVTDRWEAAHVVCLLCSFGQTDVVNYLSALALNSVPNPFYDKTLTFYELSAKQWLLIALRRAIQKNCDIVTVFQSLLEKESRPGKRHAMIRGFSASIMLEMSKHNQLKLTEDEMERIKNINHSKLNVSTSNVFDRILEESKPISIHDDKNYHFGYDVSRYWFESLGRIFSFPITEIERRARKVIKGDSNIKLKNGWIEDCRAQRGLYKDNETFHSQGQYPRTENLNFYHSYHSMMIVAGELIDSEQQHQDPEYPNELEEWLVRHRLTRSDGLWLADRRDLKPPEFSAWKSAEVSDEWPFSVLRSDLEAAPYIGTDGLCVWGTWTASSGDRIQQTRITSALVSPENSDALLRALQTTQNAFNYGIPESGGELEIDHGRYQLKGWISDNSNELRIDKFDPWAGDIGYPPLHPDNWFTQKFKLISDYERRSWSREGSNGQKFFRSEMWGNKIVNEDFYTPETGERIVANKKMLMECLASLSKELIFKVQIERKFRRNSYHNRETSDYDYIFPYTLNFIFKKDGAIKTI